MSKALSEFRAVDGLGEVVFTARKANLRCTAIRLRTGRLCLYSPVLGLNEMASGSLLKFGAVTHLLAPNHYHHKGLAEYRTAFPDAHLCCSKAAMPRLEKQTQLSFTRLEDAPFDLLPEVRLLEPDGLITGEVWMRVRLASETAWIVTDAFCGEKGASDRCTAHPQLLGTFPKFGIADRARYRTWLTREIGEAAPTTIIPCHGSIIRGDEVATRALKLVEDLD